MVCSSSQSAPKWIPSVGCCPWGTGCCRVGPWHGHKSGQETYSNVESLFMGPHSLRLVEPLFMGPYTCQEPVPAWNFHSITVSLGQPPTPARSPPTYSNMESSSSTGCLLHILHLCMSQSDCFITPIFRLFHLSSKLLIPVPWKEVILFWHLYHSHMCPTVSPLLWKFVCSNKRKVPRPLLCSWVSCVTCSLLISHLLSRTVENLWIFSVFKY